LRRLKRSLTFIIMLFVLSGMFFGITKSAFADEDVSTAYYYLSYQEPADVFLGKAGVFMISSSYNAQATINRIVPDNNYPAEDLEFFDRWLDFGIYDFLGNPYKGLYGFNYAYFNLKYRTRKLWDSGDLSIYRWNDVSKEWVECPSFLVEMKNLPHGRVTCIMTTFGLYGIAIEK
jgi:hypothetical protein